MSRLEEAIETVTKAMEEDKVKNYEEALRLYLQGGKQFLQAYKFEAHSKLSKDAIRAKCNDCLIRAENLKRILSKESGMPTQAASAGSQSNKDDIDSDAPMFQNQLLHTILKEKPSITWNDIAGLEAAKEALKEAIVLPMKFPHLFTGTRAPCQGILLFGPSGAGKSHLAKAVASEASNFTFINVTPSDLISKWAGESERLIRSLFQLARQHKPSVIFIDEIDSLCENAAENEHHDGQRIRTELLVQLRGVGVNNDNVLVLAATSVPWTLRPALRRAFARQIYTPMPDATARACAFKLHTGNAPHSLTDGDFQDLGSRAEGYSGADVSIVVRDALMSPVRRVQSATHFKRVSGPSRHDPSVVQHDLLTPCCPDDPDAQEMSWTDVDADRLQEPPPMELSDLMRSLRQTRPTVSGEDLNQFKKFIEDSSVV